MLCIMRIYVAVNDIFQHFKGHPGTFDNISSHSVLQISVEKFIKYLFNILKTSIIPFQQPNGDPSKGKLIAATINEFEFIEINRKICYILIIIKFRIE